MSEEEPSERVEDQAPTSKQRGLPNLFWGMIARPRATLEYLSQRGERTWWAPALLTALLFILPVVVAAPITARLTREAVLATQDQWGEQQEDMSAEEQAQMEQAMSVAASPLITTVFPAVGNAVGLAVSWLVWTGALYLAGMALGGRSTFRQLFRMVVWTWLPFALRGLLQTVYILVSGEIIANPGLSGMVLDNNLASGETILARPDMGQIVLGSFLGKIDLFLVWHLILLVAGVTVITHLTRRKAVLATLGVWVLLTALSLVPALVGGMFAQQVGGF